MTYEERVAYRIANASGMSEETVKNMMEQEKNKVTDPMELEWEYVGDSDYNILLKGAAWDEESAYLLRGVHSPTVSRGNERIWVKTGSFLKAVAAEHNEVLRRKKDGTW